jgi:hypothetical protein
MRLNDFQRDFLYEFDYKMIEEKEKKDKIKR